MKTLLGLKQAIHTTFIMSAAISAIALTGCSDSKSDEPPVPPICPPSEVTDFYISPACSDCLLTHGAASGHGYEFYLGHGYDITAPYLSDDAVRAKVIDLDKLDGERLYHMATTFYTTQVLKGSDTGDYLRFISYTGDFENPAGDSAPLFSGSITAPGTDNTYYTQIRRWGVSRHYFNPIRPAIYSALSDEFLSDLESLSADELVSRYGTHVVNDAVMGCMMRFDYHAYITSDAAGNIDKTDIAYDAVAKILGTSDQDALSAQLYNFGNFGATLEVSLHGADPDVDFFSGNWPWPESATHGWLNRLKPENAVMVSLSDNDLVPLTNLIKDESKRAKVSFAIDNYIRNSARNLTATVPLFQNSNGVAYRYPTSRSEADELESEKGLRCYGVLGSLYADSRSGTVELRTVISTDGSGQQLIAAGANESGRLLGYALAAPASGCVTLHEITDGKRYAYTIEEKDSYGKKGEWHPTGTRFYLLRP